MLVGQQLGPFLIEKELGSGAMGTVYLGRYVKDDQPGLKKGQALAIKVMAPGLGESNATAVARFEREAKILKQLRHPHIVRFYGAGKTQGMRFYAMEVLDGEALDKVLARRGRLTWEEVVDLGKQLCDALYHAHQAGVVHRDLKPSNLMLLPDGTLKLTDFGIAKPLDVTALTSANCTVGTASYMSPEQCKGERDITHKSDLYSLGCVFYELLTGQKPFQADNVMEMFLHHAKTRPERPSRLVMDLPVWLDNLVVQMLEKDPDHRPMDAATVGRALEQVQEKVEAQMSAGADVARARRVDRKRGQRRLDSRDREIARSIADGKRGKRARPPFYTRLWFVGLGVLAVLGGMGLALYFVLRPAAPEDLYAEAEQLMGSGLRADHDKALEGPIKAYLKHYRKRPGEQTERVRAWEMQVEMEQANEKVMTYVRKKREGRHYGVQSETEERAFNAAWATAEGKADEARELWGEIRAHRGDDAWGLLATRHLQALDGVDALDQALLKVFRQSVGANGVEPAAIDQSFTGLKQQAFLAVRYEHLGEGLMPPMKGDLARAASECEAIEEKAEEQLGEGDLRALPWWVFGAIKAAALQDAAKGTGEFTDKHREELVEKVVAEAARLVQPGGNRLRARALCMDVLTLYGDDPESTEGMAPALKGARQLLEALASQGLRHRFR